MMGKTPCCTKIGMRKGPWSAAEDQLLIRYIQTYGEGNWRTLPSKAGLQRCGKSCRLRWMNYLRPDIKRGDISPEEDDLIIKMHALLGNRWSLIAGRLPRRTDNEIKNYWNTHLSKKLLFITRTTSTHKNTPHHHHHHHHHQHDHEGSSAGHDDNHQKVEVLIPKPIRVSPGLFFAEDGIIRRRRLYLINNYNDYSMSSNCGGDEFMEEADKSCGDEIIRVDDHDGSRLDNGNVGCDYHDDEERMMISGNHGREMRNRDDDHHHLQKVYEEYLKFLETDENDGDDHDHEANRHQLDSFAEYLLK